MFPSHHSIVLAVSYLNRAPTEPLCPIPGPLLNQWPTLTATLAHIQQNYLSAFFQQRAGDRGEVFLLLLVCLAVLLLGLFQT